MIHLRTCSTCTHSFRRECAGQTTLFCDLSSLETWDNPDDECEEYVQKASLTIRVVFLDIDGVLNCANTIQAATKKWKKGPYSRMSRYSHMIDTAMVHRLNRILEATGAVCVLSSSWRTLLTPEQMEGVLLEHGFTGRIIARTGSCGHRGNEIRDWLLEHPEVESYIVLDDEDYDMGAQRQHLVQTSWSTGLQDTHVEKALQLMEETG